MTELSSAADTTVDELVRQLESAWASGAAPPLAELLPPRGHPAYRKAVRELALVDLELGWAAGRPRTAADYQREFPDAFRAPSALCDLAFEEYRQRRAHGEDPDPSEFARRYGVATDGWPRPRAAATPDPSRLAGTVATGADAGLAAASLAYRRFRDQGGADSDFAADGPSDAVDLFRAAHRTDPGAAQRLADAAAQMPEVGTDFLGFRLVGELGRGAFGRVFLAYQGDLANRPVALKVSADVDGEPQTLAQLQHTNIVPVYSAHRAGPFQAVCMPFFGGTTLADLVGGIKDGPVPDSGRHIVSTLNDRRSLLRGALSTLPSSVPSRLDAGDAPATVELPRAVASEAVLRRLEESSYVGAVLWLAARMADGLAHAHERGVVHRDLKPANVLLTDDGQPMLLDFNLSEDSHLRATAPAARMGGTLPYMSPEQLEAFGGNYRAVDARSDLYSLGLILYQLLAGRHPFPTPTGPIREVIRELADRRRKGPPALRPLNQAVTPAVEAIVRRCLEADPDERYQSARDLVDDLERHLANRPLKHTPEPSPRERACKWARRHPRLTSSTTVAAAAAVLFGSATLAANAAWQRHLAALESDRREQARLAAGEDLGRLRQARLTQQALLNAADRGSLDRLAAATEAAIAAYGALDDPAWRERPRVANLPPRERGGLPGEVGDMLLTWADAERTRATLESDPARRAGLLAKAVRLNDRAAEFLGPDRGGRALALQQARLAELLGRADAAELAARAAATPPATAADCFQLACDLVRQQEYKKAAPLLLQATRLDPSHFWAWHYLGNCYYELLQFSEAVACYSACLGLTPDPAVAYYPHYHRAAVHAAQGRYADAEADIARALECLPALAPEVAARERAKPRLLRARVRAEQKDFAAAEAELTAALAAGGPDCEVLFERARVRAARGDHAAAADDRAAALNLEPADEIAWNNRGLNRLPGDPAGAMADFEAALKINPTFHQALQNKAHVLAEHMGKPAEALAVLGRLVELYPGYVRARLGRGVLLARQGQRDKAHAEARAALARDRTAGTLYQAANIYALTSKQSPADREKVLPLLGAALWGGFGMDVVDGDPDFDPVRGQPGFRTLVGAVRELEADIRNMGW